MPGPQEHDIKLSSRRPKVPGKAQEYIYLPARGFMKARLVKKGQVLRVIDVEGKQVFDCIMWDADDLNNVMNCINTLVTVGRWDKFKPGTPIYSKRGNTLAIISEDTTDGTHAFAGAFCNEAANRLRYGIPGTVNCRDNFVAAMADYDFSSSDIDWGSCVSYFMDIRYEPDGRMAIHEPHTKPGDYIDLMAQMDIIVAISNCPQERNPCNAFEPTAMQAIIFDPNPAYQAKAKALTKK